MHHYGGGGVGVSVDVNDILLPSDGFNDRKHLEVSNYLKSFFFFLSTYVFTLAQPASRHIHVKNMSETTPMQVFFFDWRAFTASSRRRRHGRRRVVTANRAPWPTDLTAEAMARVWHRWRIVFFSFTNEDGKIKKIIINNFFFFLKADSWDYIRIYKYNYRHYVCASAAAAVFHKSF